MTSVYKVDGVSELIIYLSDDLEIAEYHDEAFRDTLWRCTENAPGYLSAESLDAVAFRATFKTLQDEQQAPWQILNTARKGWDCFLDPLALFMSLEL